MKQKSAGIARTIVLVCLCVLLGLVAIVPVAVAETIKIGHVCSITGWAGMLGSPQRDATLAMVEDLNKKGGLLGKQVEAFIEDDQSNPTTAVIAATKLVRDMKVNFLVGTTLSDCAMAVAPLADQEQVPFIVTSPVILPFKKWVFPVGPGDIKMAARTLQLAVENLGAKRIALLHDTALYGMQGAKNLKSELQKYPGVSFVAEEKYDVKDTNMIPQLTKLKALDADLIMIYGTGAVCAVIVKNYKQLGMKTPVLGSGGVGAPDFVKVGGTTAEEVKWMFSTLKISIAESLPPNDPYRKNVYEPMKAIFQNKFGKDKGINLFHVSPMDAIVMATLAIKAGNADNRVAVRDALEKVRFEGLLGGVEPSPTDHQEKATDTSVLAILNNGVFVPYAK